MINEGLPKTKEELLAVIEEATRNIAQKRAGRIAMEERGMTVEPEEADIDMVDWKKQLEEASAQLAVLTGESSDQVRLEGV